MGKKYKVIPSIFKNWDEIVISMDAFIHHQGSGTSFMIIILFCFFWLHLKIFVFMWFEILKMYSLFAHLFYRGWRVYFVKLSSIM